jgi:hypothetical protein
MIMTNRSRPLNGTRRTQKIGLYLSDAEYVDVVTAAERAGLKPAAFAAEVTLATARGEVPRLTILQDVLRALISATVPVVEMGMALERIAAQVEVTGCPSEGLESVAAMCRQTVRGLDEAARDARRSIIAERSHGLEKAGDARKPSH